MKRAIRRRKSKLKIRIKDLVKERSNKINGNLDKIIEWEKYRAFFIKW